MRVNLDLLRTRAAALRENIERIRQVSGLPDEQFWSNQLHVESLKLRLIQAIEDASSICAHLVSRFGSGAPTGYVECFAALQRHGVIDEVLAVRLQAMARFRNLLVHRYWQVDDTLVLQSAREDVSDLEDFLRQVGEYLQQTL